MIYQRNSNQETRKCAAPQCLSLVQIFWIVVCLQGLLLLRLIILHYFCGSCLCIWLWVSFQSQRPSCLWFYAVKAKAQEQSSTQSTLNGNLWENFATSININQVTFRTFLNNVHLFMEKPLTETTIQSKNLGTPEM